MAAFRVGVIRKTLDLLDESYALYQKNWDKFAGAQVGIFIVTFFIGLVNLVMGMLSGLACDNENPVVLLLFCYSFFPAIGQGIISFVLGFMTVPFTLSLMRPFSELAERKTVSSWTLYLAKNVKTAALVSMLRLNSNAIVWIPFLVFSALSHQTINEKLLSYMGWNIPRLLGTSLLSLVILALALLAAAAIVNYFLLFVEAEMVLGKKSILQAVNASIELVLARFGETFSYIFIWYAVGVALWLLTTVLSSCTCFLIPVTWIIWIGLIYPVQNISLVMLWKRVRGFKEEEKKIIDTPVPPEEYIRKAKSKMVLSWE